VKKGILLLFLLLNFVLNGQTPVSSDSTYHETKMEDSLRTKRIEKNPPAVLSVWDSLQVYYFFMNEFINNQPYTHREDTTLIYSQQQNPAFSGNNFYQTLGNAGQATKNLFYLPEVPDKFCFGMRSFSLYRTTPENLRWFHTVKPYSILDYSQGPAGDRREAQLNVDHGQYLGKNLGVGTKLYINNSLGDYDRQKAENYQFALNFHYKNRSERYGAIGAYIYNKTLRFDNAGITYDSIFRQNLEPSRKLLVVNRTNAETEFRDSYFVLSQFFNLLPESSHHSFGRIGLDSKYNKTVFQYFDSKPSTNFYPAFYSHDSTKTWDSTTIIRYKNDLYYTNLTTTKSQFLTVRAGILMQNNSVRIADTIKTPINHFTTYGKITLHPNSVSTIGAEASFTTGTNQAPNMAISGFAARQFSFGDFHGYIQYYTIEPEYQLLRYHSSHFSWDNHHFSDLHHLQTRVQFSTTHHESGIQYNLVSNYTYLNQTIEPVQSDHLIHLLRAWLYQDFSLGKFDLAAKIVYQFVSDESIVRLPGLMGKLSFQFKQPMFKKALYTRFGFDVLYTTAFYADDYMPALQQFYLQDEKSTGNYPYIDAYIKFQVKRARIFVMFTHVNSGLMDYNYFFTPGYPMRDRYLKFGVSWFFHD